VVGERRQDMAGRTTSASLWLVLPKIFASGVAEVYGIGWAPRLDRLHPRFAAGYARYDLEIVRKPANSMSSPVFVTPTEWSESVCN
jgi:hypothetical protein